LSSPRQLPAYDPDTEFFWKAGAQGRLQICRCQSCHGYIHPPLPCCPDCGGDTAPEAVSGQGRIASYTVNEQPWRPGLAVPYVFAAVELASELPMNTSGGQLSAGRFHGYGHIYEACQQLWGQAGARQVPGAKTCIVANGGFGYGALRLKRG
jgi:uncharacterized OB-fold protein